MCFMVRDFDRVAEESEQKIDNLARQSGRLPSWGASDGAYGRIHAGGIATTRKDRDVLHIPGILTVLPG